MIKEAYCSFEVAKLLKEKGFLQDVNLRMTQNLSYYDNIGLCHNLSKYYDSLIQDKIDFVIAPTHQMAMAWLREEYNIFIIVEPYSNTSCYFSLWKGDNYYENPLRKDFPSYEETVEAALKYVLENLI